MIDKSLLAGAVVAVLSQPHTAYADTRVQASSGVQYSNGNYGETTSTSALVVPFYYDWRDSSARDGEDPSSVDWRLNDAWKIELNGGVGLSDASADYTAGLTLIWRSARR